MRVHVGVRVVLVEATQAGPTLQYLECDDSSDHACLIAFLNVTFVRPFSFMRARREESLAH